MQPPSLQLVLGATPPVTRERSSIEIVLSVAVTVSMVFMMLSLVVGGVVAANTARAADVPASLLRFVRGEIESYGSRWR
jgi:hypothetical protein